jgi:L-ascorbate metabolism protein UlaG (beta-lactamase superfamily)
MPAIQLIGDHFTMSPREAAYACNTLLKPKTVIPMHYGTFPLLTGTPAKFEELLLGVEVLPMQPAQTIE